MPKSAMPPGMKDTAAGTNTDWNNRFQRWIPRSWFAYGPRAAEWWAKWREIPLVLFAVRGAGCWRWEYTNGRAQEIFDYSERFLRDKSLLKNWYWLSGIQYFCRWHLAIQWPLHITFHCYFNRRDTPTPYVYFNRDSLDGRLLYVRIGARRDADRVYWWPSFFIGCDWN